jgi:hypothetical protein
MRFDNFHMQVVEANGKLHLKNTRADELRCRMLSMIHHHAELAPIEKQRLTSLSDPGIDLGGGASVARGVEAIYLNGICSGNDLAAQAHYYGQLANGVRSLLSTPPWSDEDPSSKPHAAAVALAQCSEDFLAYMKELGIEDSEH